MLKPDQLALPVIAAPMFLVSGPELVTACCKSGIVGTFPALNQRTTEEFEAWLNEIEDSLAGVDGLIAVSAGAGGHTGTMNPFALIKEIRQFFDKTHCVVG